MSLAGDRVRRIAERVIRALTDEPVPDTEMVAALSLACAITIDCSGGKMTTEAFSRLVEHVVESFSAPPDRSVDEIVAAFRRLQARREESN